MQVYSMASLGKNMSTLLKRPFYRYGIPFVIFVIGGSFGLKEFARLRYEFAKQCPINPELAEKYGVKMRKPGEITLEGEYEKMKELNIDDWSNVRGPRPWEENEEVTNVKTT